MASSKAKHSLHLSQKVNRSSFAMFNGTLLSRITGFVRDMVIGYVFTRTETDAFFVAFRFPNFFRRFFGEGALTVSFIPVFTECLYKQSDAEEAGNLSKLEQKQSPICSASIPEVNIIEARNLMNSIYTLVLITVSSLTVLGMIFMDVLIDWMFGSYAFSQVEGKVEMTVYLARFLFLYLFLVVSYAYFTAVANALKKFFIPALAPAVFNLCIIFSIFIIPQHILSYPAMALVIGVLLGGIAQAVMVAFVLIRLKFLPRLTWSLTSSHLMTVLKKFLPAIVGVGGFAIIGVLNVFFAGWLKEGTHTYIYYADRLLELPRSLVAVSMGTALLPALSKLSALKRDESLFNLAAHQRDIMLYIILPCALILFFLGEPIVEVLFERGKFSSLATQETSKILHIYSLLLIILSCNQMLSTCFFSIKNTWCPASATSLSVLAHLIFSTAFIPIWGLNGLIWAMIFSSLVQMLFLLFAYPKLIGSLYLKRTTIRIFKNMPFLILFALISLYLFQALYKMSLYLLSDSLSLTFALFASLIVGFSGYLALGVRFKLIQAVECWNLLKTRFQR